MSRALLVPLAVLTVASIAACGSEPAGSATTRSSIERPSATRAAKGRLRKSIPALPVIPATPGGT